MSRLKARIVDLIAALGPISVSEYMTLCLSDPEHGYYMTRNPFGRDGDFTTAPEISQMFGELIGAWLAMAWQATGSPDPVVVAEIGPGRGTLMRDMVRALGQFQPNLREAASFNMIETSPGLRKDQAATLKGSGTHFDWHESVEDLPAQPLLIVGNELLDALPIRQYVSTQSGWRERLVDIDADNNLRFIAGAGSLDMSMLPPDAPAAPLGTVVEIAPAREALMQTIAERIARDGGAGLFIDYGHFTPGVGDTLQALLNHQYDDPLAHPGEADLTAHVDFRPLAEAARVAGLQTKQGTQREFLLAMGLLERAGMLGARADETMRQRLRSEVERLAAVDQMGDLFKVLAMARPGISLASITPPH